MDQGKKQNGDPKREKARGRGRKWLRGARYNNRAVRSEVNQIYARLEAENYKLYPSAKRWLYSTIQKGIRAGTIKTVEDIHIVSAALLSAATEVSENKRIRVNDLSRGWKRHIYMAGNCPPHKCFFRTVKSRQEILSSKLSLYDTLLREIE